MKRSLLALSAACLAIAAVVPASAQSPVVYSARDSVVGSMIPQAVVTAPVPFDKTWSQLSAEQQALVAQDYESLPAGDEPPFPARGLTHFAPYLIRTMEKTNAPGPLLR